VAVLGRRTSGLGGNVRIGPYREEMTVLAMPARWATTGGPAAEGGAQPGQIPPEAWAALLDDAKSRARVHDKVHRRGPGQCHYWLGALTSGGHGRVRLGVRTASARRPASIIVAPHVYLYQESRGLLRPLPDGGYPVIRHRCHESSCLNPIHLAAGSGAAAIAARGPAGSAADTRGAQGRAIAIRDAILSAIAAGATPGEIEVAIEAAAAAGIPAVQTALPFLGGIELPPGQRRRDVEVTAASAVVIPRGQGELF
jgi:hypothetical protein